MTNRHEAARKQEDAWLDDSLAELAELSHAADGGQPDGGARAKPRPSDDDPAAYAEAALPPGARPAGSVRPIVKPSTSKANRDDACHKRHGK